LVSRARQAGVVITPRGVFQHKTVAALAASAVSALAPAVGGGGADAIGRLPATPIMRWLAELGGPIDRFNQAMLLQVPAGLRRRGRFFRRSGLTRARRRLGGCCW